MKETSESTIDQHLKAQDAYFKAQQTKPIAFRLQQLRKLEGAIQKYEKKIEEALWKDLHKSAEEAYLTEISIVLNEIKYHRRNLKQWMKFKKVPTPLHLQRSEEHTSELQSRPHLVCRLLLEKKKKDSKPQHHWNHT